MKISNVNTIRYSAITKNFKHTKSRGEKQKDNLTQNTSQDIKILLKIMIILNLGNMVL